MLLAWAAGTIAAYSLACLPAMQTRLGTGLRAATAVALAGLALLHAAISAASGLAAVDPMSWAVDAALIVMAVLRGPADAQVSVGCPRKACSGRLGLKPLGIARLRNIAKISRDMAM